MNKTNKHFCVILCFLMVTGIFAEENNNVFTNFFTNIVETLSIDNIYASVGGSFSSPIIYPKEG